MFEGTTFSLRRWSDLYTQDYQQGWLVVSHHPHPRPKKQNKTKKKQVN